MFSAPHAGLLHPNIPPTLQRSYCWLLCALISLHASSLCPSIVTVDSPVLRGSFFGVFPAPRHAPLHVCILVQLARSSRHLFVCLFLTSFACSPEHNLPQCVSPCDTFAWESFHKCWYLCCLYFQLVCCSLHEQQVWWPGWLRSS